jgi:hypothetical protein
MKAARAFFRMSHSPLIGLDPVASAIQQELQAAIATFAGQVSFPRAFVIGVPHAQDLHSTWHERGATDEAGSLRGRSHGVAAWRWRDAVDKAEVQRELEHALNALLDRPVRVSESA